MLGCGSMNEETVEEFRKKHFENYQTAVMETLKNNTTVLFEDDIYSLLQKPPLDSMDIIKCKFLDLAKRYKIIIRSDVLDQVLEDYRFSIISYLPSWKKIRIDELSKIITSFAPKKESDVIKFNKNFTIINHLLPFFKAINYIIRRFINYICNDIIIKTIKMLC